MKIVMTTIDHNEQPMNTVGDWRFEDAAGNPLEQAEAYAKARTDDCVLRIRVSKMGNWKHEVLVMVHELIETLLCLNDGVDVADVDAFDMAYEASRTEGSIDEPGDDLRAPYAKQHCLATAVERLLCAGLECSWKGYDEAVNQLEWRKEKT